MVESGQETSGEYNPIAHYEYLKQLAKDRNLTDTETKKLLLGQVSNVMFGDDRNAFTSVVNNPKGFFAEEGIHAKNWLLTRLKWEKGTNILPDDLNQRLEKLIPELEDIDWSQQSGFKQAEEKWVNGVYKYFQDEEGLSAEEIADAKRYYFHITYGIPYESEE